MKQLIAIVLVVVGVIGAAVMFGKDKAAVGNASNYIYGKTDSTVKIVEFGDFECPACGAFFPIISEVKETYKDRISFQFRHFPLVQSHQNALAAHRAAEAAGKQGKFWEMHDKLYINQETWNGPSQTDPVGVNIEAATKQFESFATELSLNLDQFRTDVAAEETLAIINKDTEDGKSQYQVSGTPTIIFNGKKVDDLSTINTVEKFSAVIDEALKEAANTAGSVEIQTDPETPTETPEATKPETVDGQ